ncbi:S8 family serine peptidase [Chloroflexus aggregans]|uniref:Peptidase S8 and S53 subtilisin kexin sedolisin n=1 Tax=Chloroflexus aggregans (strain MD-66 / DSM 9485) TaxID=326427 RepID=B8G429_CHLAD|nr:S8 family serine peptidase [Chloroflexus aggregans]ACL25431.1 peptidase S8 and S53 subtilisin kexin sedolisin [Chloroflexus aggregans DSM 9485]
MIATPKRQLIALAVSLLLTMALVTPSTAQPPRPIPNLDALRLDEPVTIDQAPIKLSPSLVNVTGRHAVVIRLSENPTARIPQGAAQVAQLNRISQQQERVLARLRAIDPTLTELARLRVALNAVIVEVDGAALPALARDIEVVRINPVVDYERADQPPMETVPYIGATPEVQAAGYRGKDVRVAVLDSGIDYTHAAFGGPGTLEAYQAAYGTNPSDSRNKTLDGLFPTDRVKGGYDFVGEVWPNGPLMPDPDPIDCGVSGLSSGTCAGGHGTHVADIIGGQQGVAPEVDLFAVKVCSAVSSSCSGVAILQGLDWVADPNGDGITDDHMHIVNMSLGASYGQNYDDDSAIAVDNLQPLGILVVASAGNSSDRPYITGTPAGARTALSVAQTAVPSDSSYPITVLSTTVYGVAQPWAPIPSTAVSGILVYGASLGNALGCTAYPPGSLTGRILLVDRGTCAISIKGSNGAAAGAVAVIVANNVAGAVPPTFSFGGGSPTVPVLSITQTAGNALKARVNNSATVDFANPVSNAGSVVGTSSRGPTMGQMTYGNQIMYGQIIKPEIGAPGASISAVAGSGTGVEPFGGTSGAAPMVAGAAALLYNASNWSLSPWELKARLINTAETNIYNGPPVFVGPTLAPITRIGGGEVRINRAIAAQAGAWELSNGAATISFGLVEVTRNPTTLRRTIVVRNYGDTSLTYTITPTFRFANDAASGAITPGTSVTTITVPPRSRRTFTLTLRIDPTKLPAWVLNSGLNGGNGAALTAVEYDGYLVLDAPGTTNDLTMPWHVLPRAAGNVSAPASVRATTSSPAMARLTNTGANPVSVDPFTLIGSNNTVNASLGAGMQMPPMDLRYVGVRAFDGTGVCPANSPIIQFAVTTHQRITHSNYPVEIDLLFDTNRDGTPDYVGYTAEVGSFASDGRNAFFVGPVGGPYSAFFFTSHATNSTNTVVTLCGSQIGVTALGQQINVDAYTYDNYFTGFELSKIEGMSTVLGAPRFDIDIGSGVVPANGSLTTTVYRFNAPSDVTDSGILLQYSFAPAGREASAIIVR